MRLIITGKGFEVSDYLEDLVTKKAEKLGRYFKPDTEVRTMLSIQRGRHICEVTTQFAGSTLRCEERSGDMYSAVDACLKKLERMVRKYRTRFEKNLHEKIVYSDELVYDDEDDDVVEETGEIVRRKTFPTKPMSVSEATEQMELLGHNFFAFVNEKTSEINILYKRYDGGLGLLEPDEAN